MSIIFAFLQPQNFCRLNLNTNVHKELYEIKVLDNIHLLSFVVYIYNIHTYIFLLKPLPLMKNSRVKK